MKKKTWLLASALVLMLIVSVTAFASSPQVASPVNVMILSNSFEDVTFAMPACENHTPNFVGLVAMGSKGVCEKKTTYNLANISIGILIKSSIFEGANLFIDIAPLAGIHSIYAGYDKGFIPLARDQPYKAFVVYL